MRTAIIYNPLSGRRHGRRESLVRSIASIYQSEGHSITLFPTESRGHATELAKNAAPFHDVILSAGGDGTAHEILQALVATGSQCSLGVLPFGTGNVLATDLAVPLDPLEAACTLLSYKPRRIAAGRIEYCGANAATESRYFTVAAGIGAHAQLIYSASAYAKRQGGMFTYYYTGFHSLFTHRFEPMRATITKPNGEKIERSVVEAVAMRVASFGGLLKNWRPGGALTQNDLRLILLTRGDRGALFRYSLAAFAGKTSESAGIEFHSALRVTCVPMFNTAEASRPRARLLHAQADGEMLGTGPITMSIVPDAFSLLMPAH